MKARQAWKSTSANNVNKAMAHFDERLTRVEVHLRDVNGDKFGERDHECMMEARLRGLNPWPSPTRTATCTRPSPVRPSVFAMQWPTWWAAWKHGSASKDIHTKYNARTPAPCAGVRAL
ncbi:MAG: hypothetical protein IPF78_11480 [Flavobacteriales bacterium]|nr:hypothetical protein [Flavobacteriales bacterium]